MGKLALVYVVALTDASVYLDEELKILFVTCFEIECDYVTIDFFRRSKVQREFAQ